MTALCGIARTGGRPNGRSLARVVEALAPYGSTRRWAGMAGPCEIALCAFGLGSSQDDGGALPTLAGGDLVICADIRLHRRKELAEALHASPSESDAALVLAGYSRWGEAVVDHISGAFAFAVVDRRRGGVLLVRDHAGDRSLAMCSVGSAVAFATTALALTGLEEVGHHLDLDRATELVLLGDATSRTLVRGVRTVDPGTAVWIGGNGVSERRWWPRGLVVIDHQTPFDEQAAGLREALERATSWSLEKSTRVGALLSGGLDSTSVAAVAAKQLAPRTIHTYTSVPPAQWSGPIMKGMIADERFAVEALARRTPNLQPSFVDVEYGSILAHHEELWELGCAPVRNPTNLIWVWACFEAAASAGVDIMLTGAGGNLAFSADGPMWLVELARRGRLIELGREVARTSALLRWSKRSVLRTHLAAPALPSVVRRRHARHGLDPVADWVSVTAVNPERLDRTGLEQMLPELVDPHPAGFRRDLPQLMRGHSTGSDWAAMRVLFGIDVRDPTMDRDLLEVAIRQPDWARRFDRSLCRRAMRDLLPPEIVDRLTIGAQLPEYFDRLTAARSELLDEVEEMAAHAATLEIIDVPRIQRLVLDWPERSALADPELAGQYEMALPRAVVMSRHLRWFESRARRVASGGPAVVLPPAS